MGKDDARTRQAAFFASIRTQKLPTLRWSLRYGGCRLDLRDEDENTAIMIASAENHLKALRELCDFARHNDLRDTINLVDSDGYTALMLATRKNHVLAVKELLYAGANPRVQRRGKTAEMMASAGGNADLATLIKNGGDEPDDNDDEEDEGELSDGAVEGETSTQRSRRKKREMKEKDEERFGDLTISGGSGEERKQTKKKEEEMIVDETAAKWDEVRAVLASMKDVNSSTKELVVDRQLAADENMDSMLWSCSCLNLLNVHLTRENDDDPSPLMCVPDDLLKLTGLLTLIMNGNRIRELPRTGMGELKTLRCLELSGNCIVELPESLGELTTLETIDVSNNKLASIDQMKKLDNLTSVKADANAIESIENLKLKNKQRLEHLSLSGNKISSIPDDIQYCKQLKRLLVLDNATLKTLPSSLSNNKKLQTIRIDAKSLEDSKIKKMVTKYGNDNDAGLIKDLMPYLKKLGGGKKK